MLVLIAYLAPVYTALTLLYHPHPSQPLLKLTWVLLLFVGFLSSVRWYLQEPHPPQTRQCPACHAPNAPERLFSHPAYAELYTLDAQGNLVPTTPKPTPDASTTGAAKS